MRLVSVWVEKYMSLENLGFNLGDDIHFKFEFDPIKRTLNIDAEKTNEYFDLFKGSKIKNITGIIGNNGAGKTSFLKLLNLCESKKPIENCAVLIFKDDNSSKYIIYNYGQMFKIKQINIIPGDLFVKLIGAYKLEQIVDDNPFRNFDILFYSNLYSEHNDAYINSNNKLNRSVDYLTRNSLNRKAVEDYNKKYDKLPEGLIKKEAQYNLLKLYFNQRFKRLIKFLSIVNTEHQGLKKVIENIPFPEYLNLNYNEDLFEQLNVAIETSKLRLQRIKDVIYFVQQYLKRENDVELRFKQELIFKYFLHSLTEIISNNPDGKFVKSLEDFINKVELDKEIFKNIHEYMMYKEMSMFFMQILALNKVIDNLTEKKYKVKIKEERISLFNFYSYKIDVNENIWKFVDDINTLFNKDESPLLSFRWYPLSAGQEAILNQFVQIWEGINYSKSENLLISIDEGELYLHPEWQRQYIDLIYSFINYFVKLKKKVKNVQIILTSHSPFIVSDIPKFNLVFLKRENGNSNQRPVVTIVNSQYHQSTFGGNIFDLYKNSFFVDDFFGEYSIKWINEALRLVNKKERQSDRNDFSISDEKQLRDFIQIIGEKVLKDVLQSQLTNMNQSEQYEIINLTEQAKIKLKEEKKVKENKSNKKLRNN